MFRYIILLFILVSCNLEPNNLAESKITNNEVHFDAVEKKIIFNQEVPLEFNSLLQSWYSKNIKLSGLNGKLFIYIDNYIENITNIDNGKKVDLEFEVSFKIEKEGSISSIKRTTILIKEYSTMTGDFSLNDLNETILNTQINLINRLNTKLNSMF